MEIHEYYPRCKDGHCKAYVNHADQLTMCGLPTDAEPHRLWRQKQAEERQAGLIRLYERFALRNAYGYERELELGDAGCIELIQQKAVYTVCNTCGLLVGYPMIHHEWHEKRGE